MKTKFLKGLGLLFQSFLVFLNLLYILSNYEILKRDTFLNNIYFGYLVTYQKRITLNK